MFQNEISLISRKSATAAAKSELVMTISCSTITSGVSDAGVATAMCGGAGMDFLGTIYAMNLEYSGGRHTYEFIQSTLLGIEVKKPSAKVLSVREKLARVKQ